MNARFSQERSGCIARAIAPVLVVGFVTYVLIRAVLILGKGQQA